MEPGGGVGVGRLCMKVTGAYRGLADGEGTQQRVHSSYRHVVSNNRDFHPQRSPLLVW